MRATIIGAKILRGAAGKRLALEELIYRTAKGALDEAGLTIADIDQVAIASSDGMDGRAISSMVTAGSVGAYRKSITNSSSSGEHALVLGALEIMSGRSRLCLVANWAKPSETPIQVVDRLNMDPFFYRPLPLSRTELIGLQTEAMAAALPVGRDWAERMGVAPSQSADGAVVLILASEEAARARKRPYTVLGGFGWASDSYWRGGPELADLPSLTKAARRAYRMAGLDDPAGGLDLIEVSDFTPWHLLAICKALGLCDADDAGAFAEELAGRRTKMAVNPSGGLKARDFDFASGLAAVATVHDHLVDDAADFGQRRGLAHAASTNAAQANSVFILERAGTA